MNLVQILAAALGSTAVAMVVMLMRLDRRNRALAARYEALQRDFEQIIQAIHSRTGDIVWWSIRRGVFYRVQDGVVTCSPDGTIWTDLEKRAL